MKDLTLGINYHQSNDLKRQEVFSDAIKLFRDFKEKVVSFNFENEELYSIPIEQRNVLKRSSIDNYGGSKKVPYIKDILNELAKEETEYIGYVNSDIFIRHDFFEDLMKGLKFQCYMFKRFNITTVNYVNFLENKFNYILGSPKHEGIDCFIFERTWWLENEGLFPDDFFIGETHWDLAYKYVIENSGSTYLNMHNIWHVYHDQTWNYRTKLALNNIRLYEELTGERVVGDGKIYVDN